MFEPLNLWYFVMAAQEDEDNYFGCSKTLLLKNYLKKRKPVFQNNCIPK